MSEKSNIQKMLCS